MDFEKFVIDKLEIIDTKISDLCTRTSLNEQSIDGMVTKKVDESTVRYKNITVVFGIITSISVMFSILSRVLN